jgi:hypothetical protein
MAIRDEIESDFSGISITKRLKPASDARFFAGFVSRSQLCWRDRHEAIGR